MAGGLNKKKREDGKKPLAGLKAGKALPGKKKKRATKVAPIKGYK
jgi:hypothetical protein